MAKIIYTQDDGTVAVIHPTGSTDDALKAVPSGKSYKVVEDSVIPIDRTFRSAWILDGSTIKEDLTKAKAVGHKQRRVKRDEEFEPYDKKVALNISSSEVTTAEAERAKIRTKYATMQTNIDNATDIAGIKTALGG
mgnify:CR=1 FL=1|tara:strand:+ start:8908 stop:9315 length:408 start_codon:yes stop_codon:yes gene_type:complete